ncbi:MAG: damage-control phosphatase ARMT1 family protein [Candidatus Bathyarchaeota archaeon]
MKIEAECVPCILLRGCKETSRVVNDRSTLLTIMGKILKVVYENFSPDVTPAYIGTLRDRIIKDFVKVDPYKDDKKEANRLALKMLPQIKSFVYGSNEKDEYLLFKRACTTSVAANAIEFDVAGYNFTLEKIEDVFKNLELTVNHLPEAYKHLKRSKNILFLSDNAGEIVFDSILVERLKTMGLRVTVAVKDKPILNDATLDDAYEAGLDKLADKITTIGSDTVGLIWSEASDEIKKIFLGSDLVIAKGMGNYETLTELKNTGIKVLFLLKAKCNPVARSIGVSKGSNVALLKII